MPEPLIAVLASGRGSNLEALLGAERSGRLGGRIGLVIGNRPGARCLEVARDAARQTLLIDHRQFDQREAFDAALARAIDASAARWIVLAGFMRRLTASFVRRYRGRLINIHPSLLPDFPGLDTHRRVLEAGHREHGASVHFVTEALDAGPVIAEARLTVRPGDDAASLAGRVLELEHLLYPRVVAWCVAGRVTLDGARASFDGQPLPVRGIVFERSGERLVRVSAG